MAEDISLDNLASVPDQVKKVAGDKSGMLKTSWSVDPNPRSTLTTYTLSEGLQGFATYKSPGATWDVFNQDLSRELEGLKAEQLYSGNKRFDPYDTFMGEPSKNGMAVAFTGTATDQVSSTAPQGSPVHPPAAAGSLYEHPRDLGMQNGRLDTNKLSDADGKGNLMWTNAAYYYQEMVKAASKDGADLTIGNSYRTYDRQVTLKAQKGHMAATPGKSNHGWGMAIDFAFGSNQGSTGFRWLTAHAVKFHFHWLNERTKSPFEPWHWEFDPWGERDGKLKTA